MIQKRAPEFSAKPLRLLEWLHTEHPNYTTLLDFSQAQDSGLATQRERKKQKQKKTRKQGESEHAMKGGTFSNCLKKNLLQIKI